MIEYQKTNIFYNIFFLLWKTIHIRVNIQCRVEWKTDRRSLNGGFFSKPISHFQSDHCELTLEPNTAHRLLLLSEGNRKLTRVREEKPYPNHPERFDHSKQVLCREDLFGRCYWEADWSGEWVSIGVAYKGINRKDKFDDNWHGCNAKSWRLNCSHYNYIDCHGDESTGIHVPSSLSKRVEVYLDWLAGTLSFYRVVSAGLTHLYTFRTTFAEPLYPVFTLWDGSSVSLCSRRNNL